jgi:hypothetical protein
LFLFTGATPFIQPSDRAADVSFLCLERSQACAKAILLNLVRPGETSVRFITIFHEASNDIVLKQLSILDRSFVFNAVLEICAARREYRIPLRVA